MKQYLKICTLLLIAIVFSYNFKFIIRNNFNTYKEDNIKQVARVNGQYIELYKNGKWEKTFLKGVNIGAAKPGYFPGEFGITKEDYLRWFEYIKDMNANVIRVYTLQMPEFYEALYEFNRYNIEPLYIMHGVWIDEDTMLEEMNAFSLKIIDGFKEEVEKVIDAIHGNANVEKSIGRGYGKYTKDISPYVIGYILGIEWDPYFVESTNNINNGINNYNGKWLYTENANPIEIFFANVGDYTIDYESIIYDTQKPIAFTNWVTTDIISHNDDIDEDNTIVDINELNIKSKAEFKSGLFVSYHIYPYYPDFLNYDNKYTAYIDEDGNQNSYEAYLKELISFYNDRPVIVSEFGVPTSRGITHEDLSRGFNQGLVNEVEQGLMNKEMLEDIHSSGYAGAIIFSWQDEWFKRTWNTMDMDDDESRAYWADKMTSEQFFGLLSFDPGYKESVSYVDGNTKEWRKKDIVTESNNMKLYVKSDEEYIYFRVHKKDLDLSKEQIIIPIDITQSSGSNKVDGYDFVFNKDADFIIRINDESNATLEVNDYYDINDFLFNHTLKEDKNSNKFNVLKQTILRESITPITQKQIEQKEVEVGRLIYGNGNPKSKDYNSLADFIVDEDNIEIRIPWLMLNISNPAEKLIVDDFNLYKEIKHIGIEEISVGLYLVDDNKCIEEADMKNYSWEKWEMPNYHERLKESYYIIKKAFKEID